MVVKIHLELEETNSTPERRGEGRVEVYTFHTHSLIAQTPFPNQHRNYRHKKKKILDLDVIQPTFQLQKMIQILYMNMANNSEFFLNGIIIE